MKKTLFTLALILGGMLGARAQTQFLTLDDSKDLTPVINAAAEKGGTYNIRFSSRNVNVNTWNVLCLPFDVTPAQLSNAFGYAAIDRLIEENDDGNIHFEPSVSGIIPAGTPFLMHVGDTYKTKDNFRKVVAFTGVTVKKVEASTTVTDACGNRFIGTFSPVEVYGEKIWYMSKGKWYDALYFSEENPVSLKPMRCYIDFSGNTTKARPLIIIDEPDGTTTTIDVATFNKGEFTTKAVQDNGWYSLTGTRLTEAPTTKGIYIHQGRKVIIK
jgi:hypothetical protein